MKRFPFLLATTTLPLVPGVQSAVIYSGYQNIAVPFDMGGVYLNVDSGATSGSHPGDFDTAPWINPFFGGTAIGTSPLLRPVVSLTPGDGIDGNDRILNLSVGTLVNISSTFTPAVNGSTTHVGGGAGQFSLDTPGNIGMQFEPTGGSTRYGWLNTTISNTGAGGTITDWAYDNAGGAIVVGRVSQSAPSAGAQLFTLSPGTGESFTLGSLITDTGYINSVLKTGDGTTTLSPGNTYTGTTTVSAGILQLGGDGVLPDTSAVTLSGGRLSTGGFDDSAGIFSLSGAGIKVIDMGAGGGSLLTFLSTNTSGWTGQLQVWNWTGAPTVSGICITVQRRAGANAHA